MNIKPYDTTVRALLETSFYRIPRFQRPYSWDEENVNDFWQDTIVAEDQDYFIGSFVVYTDPSSDDILYTVDGQQRLTTITLLFAALRQALLDLGETELAHGAHKLVQRPDINNKQQYVLQSETPYPYLQEYIQKLGQPETVADVGAEEVALERAYSFLRKKISDRLASIDLDSTLSEGKKPLVKKDALLLIRDKLLRLKLVIVEVDNDDDAYLIFETLNTRGKDLAVSDLVKNHLTRLLRPQVMGVDLAKDKWLRIQQLFDEAANEININSFILHSWLSRQPYTSQKKLFREIRAAVTADNAAAFLDDLVADAFLYRKLLEPDAFQWDRQDRQIRESILALGLFRVAQPLPMMLALQRANEADLLTRKQTVFSYRSMENFHVQFTAVTSQRTGGGTAAMYASSARQLSDATDNNVRMQIIRDFIDKLRQRVPLYEEFEANFRDIYFTSSQTKQRSFVRYLLRRLDQHWRGGNSPVDYDRLTIEHIAPEGGGASWSVSEGNIGRIGNLILVTEEVNERLGSRPFSEKIAIIKEEGVPMDHFLAVATSWEDHQIEERTQVLALLAANDIFKV